MKAKKRRICSVKSLRASKKSRMIPEFKFWASTFGNDWGLEVVSVGEDSVCVIVFGIWDSCPQIGREGELYWVFGWIRQLGIQLCFSSSLISSAKVRS